MSEKTLNPEILSLGEEELFEKLGGILWAGDGMSDSPRVFKNLVIVSTLVSLYRNQHNTRRFRTRTQVPGTGSRDLGVGEGLTLSPKK